MGNTNVSVWIRPGDEIKADAFGGMVVVHPNGGKLDTGIYFGDSLTKRPDAAVAAIDNFIAALRAGRARLINQAQPHLIETDQRPTPPRFVLMPNRDVQVPGQPWLSGLTDVTIDGLGRFPARLALEPNGQYRRWNGFVWPYFDRAAVDEILTTISDIEGLHWADARIGALISRVDGYITSIVDDQGVRRWPVGAGAWTWLDADQFDPAIPEGPLDGNR